jgi:hypothetical protein
MAAAITEVPTPIESKLVVDGSVGVAAQQVSTSSGIMYRVTVDNSGNSTEAVYLKIWDVGSSPTVGTTRPDFQFPAPVSKKVCYMFPDGLAFASGLFYAVSKEAGVPTTNNPSSTVPVYIDTN